MPNQVELVSQVGSTRQGDPDELLDYDGAAAFFGPGGPTKGTLQIWVCTGRYEIPYIKLGRLVRFRRSSLLKWLSSRERGGTK